TGFVDLAVDDSGDVYLIDNMHNVYENLAAPAPIPVTTVPVDAATTPAMTIPDAEASVLADATAVGKNGARKKGAKKAAKKAGKKGAKKGAKKAGKKAGAKKGNKSARAQAKKDGSLKVKHEKSQIKQEK